MDIVARIPTIVSQSVHFILEGQRAAETPISDAAIEEAEVFLAMVRERRQGIEVLRAESKEPVERLLIADYQLGEVERDVAEAVQRMHESKSRAKD